VACFEITGPADDARRFSLAVEGGRAAPVENDMSPTVDPDHVEHRLRPAGLRSDHGGGGGGRRWDRNGGDAALARKILSHMNFMF
jgi:hypothetical protein